MADAVSTACYVLNRVLIRPILKKTPYELLKGRKPNVSHLKQADTGLEDKTEEFSKPSEVQSAELENQTVETRVNFDGVNSELPREWRVPKNLSLDNVIGNVQKGVSTRRSLNQFCEHTAFVSQTEPKSS